MNFSWFKEDKIDIPTLVKKWNDSFFIYEQIESTVSGIFVNNKPKYTLIVWRNSGFHEFMLSRDEANYLIWKLDMVTWLSGNNGYLRKFYQKSAHGKVAYGYKHENRDKNKYELEYGLNEYIIKSK